MESESGSENGSNDDVTENNCVTKDVLDLAKNSNEGFIQEVDQSIVDLANAFEARLDDPGLDTPPVSPSADDKDASPQDLPPNYVNRFGREIRPQRFLMHESFGALTMTEGDPELWRTSAQTSYGMLQKQVKDRCFFHSTAVHHCMTQLSLKQGLKEWKGKAKEVVKAEMFQMHNKHVFAPKKGSEITR